MTKKLSELIPNLEDLEIYNHVELTELETKIALFEARKKKAAEIKKAEYLKRMSGKIEFPKYTAEEVLQMIKTNSTIDVDDFNKDIVWELCLYFTGDSRCKLDATKGILLYGGVGCGKTTLMSFFRHNQKASFALITTRTISYDFAKHGHDGIYRYFGLLKTSDVYKTFGQGLIGICFDDLGTEVDKKHYGNESNVMCEITLSRYENKELHNKTHVTTNLNPDMIQERYGHRVRSRMREMFNVLEFHEKAPDRRK